MIANMYSVKLIVKLNFIVKLACHGCDYMHCSLINSYNMGTSACVQSQSPAMLSAREF